MSTTPAKRMAELVKEATAGLAPDQGEDALLIIHQAELRLAALSAEQTVDPAETLDIVFRCAFELGKLAGPADRSTVEFQAAVRKYAHALVEGVMRTVVGKTDRGPLPPNACNVTAHGRDILFAADGMHRMGRAEALYLAVWLIALADPQLESAPSMLARVATR